MKLFFQFFSYLQPRKLGLFLFAMMVALLPFSCSKSNITNNPNPQPNPVDTIPFQFAKGADISWLTEMEAASILFRDSSGTPIDGIQLLKQHGFNAIRLRVWVNPQNGWNNTADVLAKALRAKALGMRLMIDFHYSDSWADPGQQNKPAAWANYNFSDLAAAVYSHTFQVLSNLKANGIMPQWVQVGNETNDGFLWPDGKASANMTQYAALFKEGYRAVKAVDSSMQVLVHLSNGFDQGLYQWNLDGLIAGGARWDITGMSLYPTAANWSSYNNQCLANMQAVITRYQKPVMVVEVGMPWTDSTACKSFLTDLMQKTKNVSNQKGLGVFYWEPQAHNQWKGYTLGAFNNNGQPTMAIDAFKP